jgi:allene oxide cyclase
MPRIRRGLLVSGLLMAALALEGAPPAAAASLILVERATTDHVTKAGPKADNVGDILTFANEVYDQADKKLLGRDNGWCVRVVVGESWQCRWTLILDGGQINVQGPFYDKKDSVLAVTGGTGNYSSVQGQMKLRQRDQAGTEYEFIYSLVE